MSKARKLTTHQWRQKLLGIIPTEALRAELTSLGYRVGDADRATLHNIAMEAWKEPKDGAALNFFVRVTIDRGLTG